MSVRSLCYRLRLLFRLPSLLPAAAHAASREDLARTRRAELLEKWIDALERFESERVQSPAGTPPNALWPPRAWQGANPRLQAELALREALTRASLSLVCVYRERSRSEERQGQAAPEPQSFSPGAGPC